MFKDIDQIKLRLFLALVILGIIAILFYQSSYNVYKNAFLPSIIIQIFSIIITVFVIDYFINKREKEEKRAFEKIGAKKLQRVLKRLKQPLDNIVKESNSSPAQRNALDSLREMQSINLEVNTETIDLLSDAPVIPQQSWSFYISHNIEKETKKMESVIDTYSPFLKSDIVKAVNVLLEDSLITLMKMLPSVIKSSSEIERNTRRISFGNHINALVSKMHTLNKYLNDSQKIE